MDGRKPYRFTVRWGEERDTDDAEGRAVATSDVAAGARRRSRRCCRAFTGTITQVPPQYSAIKIDGERAYDLARDGEEVELEARAGRDPPARPGRHRPDADHAVFEAECGKGTYVRVAGARYGPGARLLRPCRGAAARRRSARSAEETMISLEQLTALCQRAAAGEGSLADALTAR